MLTLCYPLFSLFSHIYIVNLPSQTLGTPTSKTYTICRNFYYFSLRPQPAWEWPQRRPTDCPGNPQASETPHPGPVSMWTDTAKPPTAKIPFPEHFNERGQISRQRHRREFPRLTSSTSRRFSMRISKVLQTETWRILQP